jgi:hypothetical protein
MLTVHQVRLRHEVELMAIPEVVAVADSAEEDMSVIRVFIAEPPRQATIPAVLEGYLVEVITAGE